MAPWQTQAQRRSTLTHELVHVERGSAPPLWRAQDEHRTKVAAAYRLISLERLIDGLRWARSWSELAEELWVDEETARIRVQHLHPSELGEGRRGAAGAGPTVTDVDVAILAALKPRMNEPRGRAIAAAAQDLGLSPTALAQRLNRLLTDPEALAAEPMLLGVWRRRRDSGMRQRSPGSPRMATAMATVPRRPV